jgi:hypothetical protein
MLKNQIINTIRNKLAEHWISDYLWEHDFACCYFENWFYTAEDCFYIINNDAREYSNMLYFVEYYDKSFTTTVDLFNMYTYTYALYCLQEDPGILEIIRNFKRISKVRHALPLILSRLAIHEVSSIVRFFVGDTF